MDDLKSIYDEESINELIHNLSEHLKLKQSSNSSRCNLSSTNLSQLSQDKTYSPYSYSPDNLDHNNSLSSIASDYLQQQQQNQQHNQNVGINGMETYFLMQNLLKRGELINEAVRRLKFNQQIKPGQANQTRI